MAVAIPAVSLEPPTPVEQERVLAEAKVHVLNQETVLPDFICMQTTRRFVDTNGQNGWRPIDIIVEGITYFEHQEIYKVIEVNGIPASVAHEKLGGASSKGEFGSLLKSVFAPESQTDFSWQTWFTLRGRLTQVYTYRVFASKSNYRLRVPEKELAVTVGYHGLIFIDAQKRNVLRITSHPDAIPLSFPIQDASLAVDYDYTRIGDAYFLLPSQFELRFRSGGTLIKNDVDFYNYQKFTTDSNISFGPPRVTGK